MDKEQKNISLQKLLCMSMDDRLIHSVKVFLKFAVCLTGKCNVLELHVHVHVLYIHV